MPITHREWRARMGRMINGCEVLAAAIEQQIAGLVQVGGGETQLAMARASYTLLNNQATTGHRILTDTTYRYMPVAQAQARAGGVREVADDKRYNTTD